MLDEEVVLIDIFSPVREDFLSPERESTEDCTTEDCTTEDCTTEDCTTEDTEFHRGLF
jgi:hypothetical protein